MTTYRSDLLRIFQERGFIHQVTDPEGLDALAARREVVGYIGFDCTADSLHIGSLVQIMMLRRLQQAGHKKRCIKTWTECNQFLVTGRDKRPRCRLPCPL